MATSVRKLRPLLKKGISYDKNFLVSSKDLRKLKKLKWQNFLQNRTLCNSLIRNDVFLISHKIRDLRKGYKYGLLQKQKLSTFLNTTKKSFLKQTLKYSKKRTLAFLIDQIELRLDMVLFRANFVRSLSESRWLISQGFVSVNSRVARSVSYKLKRGDIVKIIKLSTSLSKFSFNLPTQFLEINYETLSIIVLDKPSVCGFVNFYNLFFDFVEISNFNKKA